MDISTPLIKNSNYCVNESEIECLYAFDSFFTLTDINALCESACPKQCHTIDYKLVTNSMATFPTLTYLRNQLAGNWSNYMFPNTSDSALIEFAKNGFLKLIINYDNLYYTSIDEVPVMSSSALFGYIGGQLGLFMGLSVLSFLEIIDLFVTYTIAYISFRIRKSKELKEKQKNSPSIF